MRTIWTRLADVAFLWFVSLALGCGAKTPKGAVVTGPPKAPTPPEEVNCIIPTNSNVWWASRIGAGDTIVVARIDDWVQYSIVTHGKYHYLWYHVTCSVLKVERGVWNDGAVTFVCYDQSPTRESGIIYRKGRFWVDRGAVYAFGLDTSPVPASILCIERRSLLPPHGSVKPPEALTADRRKAIDAAWAFLAKKDGVTGGGGASMREETQDYYVVEINAEAYAPDPRWVVVEKDSCEARHSLPSDKSPE